MTSGLDKLAFLECVRVLIVKVTMTHYQSPSIIHYVTFTFPSPSVAYGSYTIYGNY